MKIQLEVEMGDIVILGVFVADAAFRAKRQPKKGETIIGSNFTLGPGGKGSNQAVAAARLGSNVSFLSKLGKDEFAEMANDMWKTERVNSLCTYDENSYTGAAYIFVDEVTGENAIIVVPGAGRKVNVSDLINHRKEIESASLFMTQLETPIEAAHFGLNLARNAGVTTVLNPAPSEKLDQDILTLCDFLIPNETEAEDLTGIPIHNISDASRAAAQLREYGVGTVIITLGEKGAFFDDGNQQSHIQPAKYSNTVETTGAGDSFCGAFAHAVTSGRTPIEAAKYACTAASISVTRKGTASSMPTANEVEEFINRLNN